MQAACRSLGYRSEQDGEDEMRIRLLGTGTPTPSLRRMCSGYVVETGNDVIVFDHGFGAHHRLLELGIAATKVSHLFLTHLHYDHCGDYARLVLTRWDQGAGKVPELPVYGPPPLKQMNAALLGEGGAFNSDLVARTSDDCSLRIYEARGGVLPRVRPNPKLTELAPGAVIEEQEWRVEVSEARHFQPYLACLAYRLTTSAGSFVYSGDSGPCDGIRKLARDCDVLVHMCHYISGAAQRWLRRILHGPHGAGTARPGHRRPQPGDDAHHGAVRQAGRPRARHRRDGRGLQRQSVLRRRSDGDPAGAARSGKAHVAGDGERSTHDRTSLRAPFTILRQRNASHDHP